MNKKNQGWLNQYLENCSKQNKSIHTIKNYKSDLDKYLLWYEFTFNSPISAKKKDIIGLYKSFLLNGGLLYKKESFLRRLLRFRPKKVILFEQSPLSNNSTKRHLSSIKNFYEFLKQTHEDHSNLFLINPVKEKIHGIKVKDTDITHTPILPYEQWRILIESTYRTRERLILQLLYWGGLRLSELTQLKFSNFDSQRKTMKVIRKGGYIHEFHPQRFDEIMKDITFLMRDAKSDFIFTNYLGNCLSTRSMYNLIKKLLKVNCCDEDLGPHSFRKACATNLYKKTKDLLLVRDYLNHHDAKVTQTYIDIEPTKVQ
ncbi:site-specific integrase [Halobacteriovorax sp. JY17]|uniref:tyrosine-type recombinase/integrase n=1 Tax=Halobacteriovorax sp. JY17 TaxID=2014617 RepID=UPI0025B9AA61|nr:site-specific integrase [Halobacteriovorax sp. JY17]